MKRRFSQWMRYSIFLGAVSFAILGGNFLRQHLQTRNPAMVGKKTLPSATKGVIERGRDHAFTAPDREANNSASSVSNAALSEFETRENPIPVQPGAGVKAVSTSPNSATAGSAKAIASQRVRRDPPKEMARDVLAREALSEVGSNPKAEAYWVAAINDPSLGAQEREDLIEDLNEEGISDPKHPTRQDLALIEGRMSLIKKLEANPLDAVNAAAFAEAYQDLVQLASAASGFKENIR